MGEGGLFRGAGVRRIERERALAVWGCGGAAARRGLRTPGATRRTQRRAPANARRGHPTPRHDPSPANQWLSAISYSAEARAGRCRRGAGARGRAARGRAARRQRRSCAPAGRGGGARPAGGLDCCTRALHAPGGGRGRVHRGLAARGMRALMGGVCGGAAGGRGITPAPWGPGPQGVGSLGAGAARLARRGVGPGAGGDRQGARGWGARAAAGAAARPLEGALTRFLARSSQARDQCAIKAGGGGVVRCGVCGPARGALGPSMQKRDAGARAGPGAGGGVAAPAGFRTLHANQTGG
jgi:hypothetical protein